MVLHLEMKQAYGTLRLSREMAQRDRYGQVSNRKVEASIWLMAAAAEALCLRPPLVPESLCSP